MKVTYDAGADALYIELAAGESSATREVLEGVILDLDTEGKLLGIEILEASSRYSPGDLAHFEVDVSAATLATPS